MPTTIRRWDVKKDRAFCTCIEAGGHKSDSIFDVTMKVVGLDFEAAKIRVAELIGRIDLIRESNGGGQKTDRESLLSPPAGVRDDRLVGRYLAPRLGVGDPDMVVMPSTRTAGWRALGYYDSPPAKGGKPKLVASPPCAVFETVAADGRRHAHRIYLAADGRGKADLGLGSNGKPRDPKKSARLPDGAPKTAGCCVIWGDPDREHVILAEGIETAAAIAYVSRAELERRELAVLSAVSAGGIEAFIPWSMTRRITVAADRDEAKPGPSFKRGERAARNLGLRLAAEAGNTIEVHITLPGDPGAGVDFLDMLRDAGPDTVRRLIADAPVFKPTAEEIEEFKRRGTARRELKEIAGKYPLPPLVGLRVEYRALPSGKIWLHRWIKNKEDKETGEKTDVWVPVCSPFSVPAWLRLIDEERAYALRLVLADVDGVEQIIDFRRGDLAQLAGAEIRSRLMTAGMRVANGGELTIVEILKQIEAPLCLDTASTTGWHGSAFLCLDDREDQISKSLELLSDVRLPIEVVRSGTLAGWQAAASAAAQVRDCPHWTLALATGFAGPILQLCDFDTCGMNLSGPTSCGKTLAQQLAVSVWSSPRLTSGGLLKPARFTANSIELLARQSNGLILGLDELALIDGKTLSQVIYGLAANVGKARMTIGLKLQRPVKWATFVLLSCERTLDVKIRGDGGQWSGGLAVRFVDIDCSEVNRKVPRKILTTIDGIFRNHGEAGRAFIRALIDQRLHQQPDSLRRRVLEAAQNLAGRDSGGARARSALPFALIAVAGLLARELGVLPQAVDVNRAVALAWDDFGASLGAGALDPEEQAEANLRRHVAEHRDITLKKTEPEKDDAHNNRDAIGWYDGSAIYIPVDRIVEAAGGMLSERAVGRMLSRRKLIARHRKGRLTVNYVPKIGYVPCYALKLSEFNPRKTADADEVLADE
jgi:hypothetical protein